MAKFEITSPDGKRFEVTAPDGASEDEILSFAQQQTGVQDDAKSDHVEQDNRSWTDAIKDSGKAIMGGVHAGVGDAIGAGIEFYGEKTDSPNAQEFGRDMRTFQQKIGKEYSDSMSERGQALDQKQLFDGVVPNLDGDFLPSLGQKALRSLPGMVVTAPVGGAVASGIAKFGGTVIPGVAGKIISGAASPIGGNSIRQAIAQQGVARALTDRALALAPTSIGYGGAEGALAGLQNSAQIRSEIEQTPFDQLVKTSPLFAKYTDEAGGDMEAARNRLAKEAAEDVAVRTAISTGGFGILTGGGALGGAARAVKASGGKGALIEGAKGFIRGSKEEAIQEFPQSGGEAYITNLAKKKYIDPAIDATDGVLSQAMEGMAVGAATGGVFGGSGGIVRGYRNNQNVGANETGDQSTGEQVSADDIYGAPEQPISAVQPTESDKALYTPKSLTALDRVNEIDTSLVSAPDMPQAEIDALTNEREHITESWPKAAPGAETSFSTETGARLNGQYALMEAGDLTTSHDENLRPVQTYPTELQPRERERHASEMQVQQIVGRLDPARLGESGDVATGAPIVGADGLVESGNARTIALKRVYQANGQKASDYKQFIKDNASRFGIAPESVDAMQKPVLVRIRQTPVNRAEFARQANASTVARMSPSEQAKSDAMQMDSLDDLNPDEQGDFMSGTSRPFVRRFMAKLPVTEQSGLIDSSGQLSQTGYTRIRNAVLAKAYGDSPVLLRMVESVDDDLRNVSKALLRVAPNIAKAREAIGEGALHDADITPDLMAAVEELSELKKKGVSVEDALAQAGIFGDKLSPESKQILMLLNEAARSPRRIAEFIQSYLDALTAAGNPGQEDIFGGKTTPAKSDLMEVARRAVNGEPTTRSTDAENNGVTQEDRSQPQDAQGNQAGNSRNETAEGNPNNEWVAFPPDSGTLGVPRAEMPQVKSEHRGALTQFLKGRGIESRTLDIPAADLKPTQAEFSRKKAAAWKEVRDGVDRSVLASSDGHVLDGHHQWVAALALNEPVKVIQFDAPIKKLLDEVKQFPSVERSEGGSVDARREAINQQWNEALADLGAIVRDHANVARVIPEDTPGLMPTLVKLFEVGIAEVGHDMKVLMAHVKNALKKIPEFKSVWNKIDNATYRKAALKALDNTDAAPQGDLFSARKPKADQGGLFDSQPKVGAGKTAMIDGRPYDMKRDNYKPISVAEFVNPDALSRIDSAVEQYYKDKPDPGVTQTDRAKAEALIVPMLEKAKAAKAEYDQKIIDIAKKTGAVGQILADVKSLDRAVPKLVRDYRFDVSMLMDILRSTLIVNSYDEAQAIVDAIEAEFDVVRVKNVTESAVVSSALVPSRQLLSSGYRNVLVNVNLPNGLVAEIQINTPAMLSAKANQGHILYELERDLSEGNETRAAIEAIERELYQLAAAFDATGGPEAKSPLRGSASRGSNSERSNEKMNTLPSGNLTQSSPLEETTNSQPSGNSSGTFISTTSSDRVAQNLDSSYTETENKSRSDSNGQYGKAGSGGAQEQGSGTAQGSQGRRGTQRVRQGQGGGNQFTNDLFGASDSRETGARQDGRPAGENGDNEQRDTGGTRNRASRATGIPAGRDIPAKSGLNYRFSDADLTYEGGWLTKARQNVDAVELIKKLEAEGRQATKDEQAILAKFIGWGASGIRNQIFSTRPWELDKQWKELRERVRGLLTADEMATAERSTQYAHYTSRAVVQSMWKAMDRMGFKGGAILEPGAGIGIFPGLMTPAMATNSVYTGIEFDNITGAILKQLFPDERIAVESFVDSALPDNFYDVAIGNPPFANIPILSDPRYKRLAFSLHDYFFAKSIDKVKPGGLMVYVTSRYTMDKQGDKARKYLSDRAELIGAIRLPQTAFMKNAGTEVVTDVLFLRKFQSSPGGRLGATTDGNNTTRQPWIGVQQIETPEGQATINEYFAAHPEMVLGTHSLKGSMYGKDEYTVLPKEGDIEAQFDAAVENLPKDIYQATGTAAKAAQVREIDFNPKAQKEGNYYLSDAGILMQREGGVGVRADAGKNEKTVALLKDYVRLRDTLLQSHYDQLNDGPWEDSLKALQKAYRDFTKKHGNLLQNKAFERITKKQDEDTGETIEDTVTWRRFDLRNKISDDPDSTLVESLEVLNEETGEITPSPWLSSRILNKPSSPRIETPHDALLSVLNDTGKVDIPLIAERLGIDEQEAIAMLGTAIYESPSAGWQMADEYLSGNIKKKLKEAQESVKTDRRYERNIEALINAQPAPVPPSDITAAIGMNWIPESDYEKFLKEKAGVTAKITYTERTGQWTVTAKSGSSTAAATSDWGTLDRNAADILQHALSGNPIRVTRTEGSGVDKKSVFDAASTEAANQKLAQMREAFADWLWKDGQRTDELTRAYNDKFNTTVSRSFDGRHLTLPGKTSTINVFDHVKRGAWRIIQSGNTYLAHSVGAGKTWAAVISAMEQKRLGLIKKPMMVVPNHMLQQFAREWLQLYPTAKLMVADEKQFHTDNRRRFVSRVALSDVDGVIITHSAFKLLDLDPEFKEKMITEQLDYLRAALEEAGGEEGQRSRDPKVRDIQNRIEKMEQKLEAAMSSDGKDKNVRFDQLGVDQIYVDEAHEFRKLAFTTLRQVKGIDSSGSDRAFDLWMKTRWLEQKKPGRSLVMMSGTPITNTLAELYSVQRFMSPQALEDRGLQDFDAWASMFGQENTEIEADASGKYSQVTRFTKFVNVPEMTQMFREFSDVLTADHLAVMLGDKRPKVKNGSRSLEVTPQTEDYSAYKEALALRLEESRAWKPSQGEPNNPDPIIRIIGDGRLAAIDMRFVDPSLPSDPDSKLNKMIDGVIEVYRRTANNEYMGKDGQMEPDKGGSQMVFSDLGFGAGVTANRGFNARAWMEKRLRDAGIPAKQVAFMGDHKKSTAKLKLFKDVNAGRVRILVGSSKNMGTGVNAQQRLIALHHLDTPWYPADLEQREGRIIRQGNKNPLVEIYAFSTKGSYDAVMWQMLASKQQFIDQALSGDTSVRSIDDLSDVSQFQIATAMTAGDPRAIQLAGIKADISKYQRLFRAHEETRSRLRHDYDLAGEWIASADRQLPAAEKMAKKVVDLSGENFKARAGDKVFDKRKEWAEALLAKFKESAAHGKDGRFKIGEISSFPIEFFGKIVRDFDDKVTEYRSQLGMTLGEEAHVLVRDVNDDPVGISMRATNTLAALARKPSELKQRIEDAKAKRAALVDRLDAKFQFAQELSNRISEADALEAAMMADQASDENTDQQDNSTDTPRLSRADNPLAGGVSIASVGQEADNILGGLGNAPDVKVVWRPSDLPFDAPSDTRGAMYKGTLYLVAGGIRSAEDVREVTFHELAHFGLRGFFGSALDAALGEIHDANPRVRLMAAAWRSKNIDLIADLKSDYSLSDNDIHYISIDEALAKIAQTGESLKGWKRFAAVLQSLLRSMGLHRLANSLEAKTDAEALLMLKKAELFATRGLTAKNYMPEAAYPLFMTAYRGKAVDTKSPTSEQRAETIIQTKAGTPRPFDVLIKGVMQAAQIDKLTMAAYNKAGFLLDRWTPETIKAGMVSDYGIPEAVIDQRAIVQGRQKRQLRAAGTLLEKLSTLTRAESRIAYEWMNTDNPQSSDWFMEQLPPESIKTLAEVEKMIDGLSKEAVRLGQLDEEAYKRNRFAYLHRSYAKHTAELTGGETAARKRAIAVLGDQYKGRGMTDAVDMAKIKNGSPEWWNRKTQQGKADKQLKGERFIRLERRASSGEGTAAIPGMSDKSKGRLLEVAYWPAGEAIPARYGAWDQMGTWEVRDTKGNNLIVWRDFTKQERELMGEIDEARYAIAKTLHGMIHDVETGKYLQWLGQNYAKIDGEAIDGKIVEASDRMRDTYKTGEWVKVPDVVVPGTKVKRYGALAGRYLPAPIWNDVRQTIGFRYQPLGETYAAIHRAWKASKTALSPAVHMNNVMANFVMADWHDVTAGHVLKALRLMTSKDAAADEVLARFGDSGGSIGTWVTKELQQEQLRPLLDALEKELGIAGNVTGQVGVMSALQLALKGRFPSAWDALKPSAAGKITVKTARAMIDLYEAEDQVFRLAAWLKAKEDGATDQVAGKVARKSFLDYNINAPWVQMMRNTALPFVAFTYRAAPMMLEIAAKKPWKLIKLGLLAGAINALGYMLSGGDEDDERKLLPEEKAGRIWGITPKLIRMPWNDANGSPVFLDIRRWIPVGDIFDTGQSHAALPILPSMTPGGPLALMAELMLNKQGFTGKSITLETDTAYEQAAKLTDYLYKAFAPNIAVLPGTYAWTGIANAGSGKTDAFGREQSLAQSIISSVGIKLGSYPPDVLRLNAQRAAQAKMMEIDKNITALKREFQKKGIDRDEFNAKAKAQIEKKRAVAKEFMERAAGH